MGRLTKPTPELEQADLKSLMMYLSLPKTAESYLDVISLAEKGNWSHLKFLETLINQEAALKKERAIKIRLGQARFPTIKTIDAFDFSFPSTIHRHKVLAALSLQFLERREGFIFMGSPGTGKTHLALSIGYAACLKGVRTLFTSAVDMINILSASLADHSLHKALKTYTTPRLLIIDEVGYLPFDQRGADLFFQVISSRYEQGSVILTTNRAFKDWGKIFHDNTVASAIIDRLTHHSELIKIEGGSYRVKHRASSQEK